MDPISSQGGGEEGPSRGPQPPPDSGGIRIGDVGGSVNFSALGDIVGGDKITTITTTIQISVEAITQRPLITASPYRGLDRFEDRDKDLFFGRDQLIKRLLAQLSASNVLLVLGASGSGKSSVVRAGLLPQLSQLIGAKFRYFTFVPDVNPFESLRGALQGEGFSQTQTRELAEARPETPANLAHTLQRSGDQWLFFVDQFEEIFTVGDEKLRASFVEALVQIAQDSNSSTKLVLAMRADFLDRFSPFPQFAKIIEKNIDFVADMHADELRQAIEQPAARHGVVFEQGLVEEIIKDVQGQAGSLPLLQYTLDLLWQEEVREDGLADRHLNTRAYRELGGVRGALQKRADEIYASFGDGTDAKTATPKQAIVRQIFLRLVDLAGEGSNDAAWRPVRRRASMAMFSTAQEQEILQALINQKLLVSNREGDDATVEVAHEALFTSWGRLKHWIEAGKQVIFARNRLSDDARRWQRREQEGDAAADEELLSGSRLSQALDMRGRGDFITVVGGVGEMETQFLDASVALRDRRRQEEQERQQRELAQAQALAAEQKDRADEQAKANARQRRLTHVMIALALIAAGVAVFAVRKQKQATIAAEKANIATLRAISSTDAAQDALTRTFVRTIGVSEDKDPLTPDERAALWELSELDPASALVREKVIDHWLQTDDSLVRARRRHAQGLHAAIGLNVVQRNLAASKARDIGDRLTKALENPQQTNAVGLSHFGDALNSLAPWMEPKDAASLAARGAPILARALVNLRDNDRDGPSNLGTALGALAARVDPRDAAKVAEVLADALENPRKISAARWRILGFALTAMAARMESKDAAIAANRMVKAVENAVGIDAYHLWSLSRALSAMAARMEPKDAALLSARGAEVVATAMENPKENDYDRLSSLGYALAGLASKMEFNDAARLAGRCAQVLAGLLENPKGNNYEGLSSLGHALATLASRMDPKDVASIADRLARALENPQGKDSRSLSTLSVAIVALAPRMEPKDVASIANRLVNALENSPITDADRLSSLSGALAAMASRMEQEEAALVSERGAQALTKALENPQVIDALTLARLARALAALAARLERENATRVAARFAQVLDKKLENPQATDAPYLGAALATLAAWMDPNDITSIADRLAQALENPQERDVRNLSSLGFAVAVTAAQMEPKNAARVAMRGVQVVANTMEELPETDAYRTFNLSSLADALAALAAQMEPRDAARVATRGAQVLLKELDDSRLPDADHRSMLGWSLGDVSRLIPQARQTRLAAFSNLLLKDVSDIPKTGEKEPEEKLAELYTLLSAQDLAEVLKWPLCVGEAQKIALAELEKKTERKFGGNVWNLVEQAPSLGIKDLNLPPKRPRIEDALNELKAFPK